MDTDFHRFLNAESPPGRRPLWAGGLKSETLICVSSVLICGQQKSSYHCTPLHQNVDISTSGLDSRVENLSIIREHSRIRFLVHLPYEPVENVTAELVAFRQNFAVRTALAAERASWALRYQHPAVAAWENDELQILELAGAMAIRFRSGRDGK